MLVCCVFATEMLLTVLFLCRDDPMLCVGLIGCGEGMEDDACG